jgi:hypothetical protein
MIYLTANPPPVSVANTTFIPFNNANPNNSSTVTFINSGGTASPNQAALKVKNAGVYMVTFGFDSSTNSSPIVDLIINNQAAPPPAYQRLSESLTRPGYVTMTTIVFIPAGGTLSLQNNTGGTISLTNATPDNTGLLANITTFRLQ